jgi:hypothetical protein
MSSASSERPRGFWGRLFQPFHRSRVNPLPAGAVPLLGGHEPSNVGRMTNLRGQWHTDRYGESENLLRPEDASRLRTEIFIEPLLAETNIVLDEAAAYQPHVLEKEIEEPNMRETLLEMIAAHPEIDMKGRADWEAFEANKDPLTQTRLDPETEQRARFARYLVQRGTYNEGFETEEMPPHYRNPGDEISMDDFGPE